MQVTEHQPGRFSWLELVTSDAEAAKTFYTSLFGWTTRDVPMGGDDVYVMLEKEGDVVGALYETKKQPPAWNSYITVRSVDESAETAKRLGGTIVGGPRDVMDAGRMAYVADPQGATFSLWQPNRHTGAKRINEPGSLCWNELATSDRDGAVRFYSELLGWRCEPTPDAMMPYMVAFAGDERAGGIYTAPPEMAAQMPPNWMPYIAVADCDASTDKGRALGGTVAVGPLDIPNIGRFSMIRDPQGAFFCIIELTM
jgi:predicted enzyme related to lactoylglutathione lyase